MYIVETFSRNWNILRSSLDAAILFINESPQTLSSEMWPILKTVLTQGVAISGHSRTLNDLNPAY